MKKYLIIFVLLIFVISCSDDKNPVKPKEQDPDLIDTTSVWDSYAYPEVGYVNTDSSGNGKYFTLYFDSTKQQLRELSKEVCMVLYKAPSEVINIKKIELKIEVLEGGVAHTIGTGVEGEKRIVFGSAYLKRLIDSRTTQEIKDEIKGVLAHELTHVFQESCEYQNDGWSLIEGMADAVRYLSGNDKLTRRRTGGSYTDGYTTTGFFIVWLKENKDEDFVYELNQYAGKHYDFKWASAAYSLLDKSIEDLWTEYQAAIK